MITLNFIVSLSKEIYDVIGIGTAGASGDFKRCVLIASYFAVMKNQNVFANLGWTDVVLPHPVFEGDTIRSRSEVLEARVSKSRPNVGVVTVRTEGLNQRGEEVISFKRTLLVYKQGHGPRFAS